MDDQNPNCYGVVINGLEITIEARELNGKWTEIMRPSLASMDDRY